jgi:hypothetical protein
MAGKKNLYLFSTDAFKKHLQSMDG